MACIRYVLIGCPLKRFRSLILRHTKIDTNQQQQMPYPCQITNIQLMPTTDVIRSHIVHMTERSICIDAISSVALRIRSVRIQTSFMGLG